MLKFFVLKTPDHVFPYTALHNVNNSVFFRVLERWSNYCWVSVLPISRKGSGYGQQHHHGVATLKVQLKPQILKSF